MAGPTLPKITNMHTKLQAGALRDFPTWPKSTLSAEKAVVFGWSMKKRGSACQSPCCLTLLGGVDSRSSGQRICTSQDPMEFSTSHQWPLRQVLQRRITSVFMLYVVVWAE